MPKHLEKLPPDTTRYHQSSSSLWPAPVFFKRKRAGHRWAGVIPRHRFRDLRICHMWQKISAICDTTMKIYHEHLRKKYKKIYLEKLLMHKISPHSKIHKNPFFDFEGCLHFTMKKLMDCSIFTSSSSQESGPTAAVQLDQGQNHVARLAWEIPSGKRLQTMGKSRFLMGKSTINYTTNGHVQSQTVCLPEGLRILWAISSCPLAPLDGPREARKSRDPMDGGCWFPPIVLSEVTWPIHKQAPEENFVVRIWLKKFKTDQNLGRWW